MTHRQTLTEMVAAEVRAEMGRAQVTQTKLAQELGRSDMYVSRRLTGQVAFDMAELERIAEVLQVPVNRLLSPPERVA